MKKICMILVLFYFLPVNVEARKGCCSRHGGVVGCSQNGKQVCLDGTLSSSCTCHPNIEIKYGCTDPKAKNYDKLAAKEDGTCKYYKYGCTDPKAKNYDELAEKEDGTCKYYKYGCTDSKAKNYDELAEKEDGTCIYNKEEDNNKITDDNQDASATTIGVTSLMGISYLAYKKLFKRR